MTEPAHSPPLLRRRSLYAVIVVWAIIAAMLWRLWPLQPRFALEQHHPYALFGISADSHYLVAYSNRTTLTDDKDYTVFASGPLQVWDLQTGRHRFIDLPFQKKLDRPDPSGADEEAMLDPDGWWTQTPPEPFQGSTFTLIQTNQQNESWKVQVNLDDGSTTQVRLPDFDPTPEYSPSQMSRTGRWSAGGHGQDEKLRVIDQKSGTIVLDLDLVLDTLSFSYDETLLAFVATDSEGDEATQIWQLQPLKHLHTFTENEHRNLAISNDNKWLATHDHILDLATLEPVVKLELDQTASFRKPRFTPDGRFLVAYGYLRGGTSGIPGPHCDISEVHVWDLVTKKDRRFISDQGKYFVDPNACADAWTQPTTPLIVQKDTSLLDVRTGDSILEVPDGTTVEFLDDRWVIVQKPVDIQPNAVFDLLVRWNVPFISAMLNVGITKTELLLYDRHSRQLSFQLPPNEYATAYRSLLVSPDGRTLVTSIYSDEGEESHRVWNLPTQKSLLAPLAWSLLIPGIAVLWSLWRRWRTRARIAT